MSHLILFACSVSDEYTLAHQLQIEHFIALLSTRDGLHSARAEVLSNFILSQMCSEFT